MRDRYEFHHVGVYLFVIVLAHLGDANFGVERRQCTLFVVEHFFVKFLTSTQPRVLYLDVLSPRKAYHTLSQVGYSHGFAHIEDENLAAVALRSRFQHQLTGLGYEHEETNDVGVGNGYGASGLNLPLEKRDNRAVRAQHIAKARGNKLRIAVHLALFLGLI